MRTVDYHTAGEPFRIVAEDAPHIPGATVRERREHALADPTIQRLRELLCHEPRGHADMYGGFITPPDDDGADFGVLFWHKDGFSTACGHGSIALGIWAIDTGRATGPEVVIDVPSGRVTVRVGPEGATFRNVSARVVARGVRAGADTVDLAYAGALYASLLATVTPERLPDLIARGRAIKAALAEDVYGVIFHEEIGAHHQRNVTIFADGQVDRSPCGSGTSARLALLHDAGALPLDTPFTHDSIIGTRFVARVVTADPLITEVTGMAYRTGSHDFVLDPDDPVGTGFVLR